MQKPILQVKNVSKKYGKDVILDGISLEVLPGEFLAIVGKSGTGKSSLLRIMSGYLDADQGEVLFNGEALEGPAAKLVPGYEEIQLVHQQFDLHPFMSAEENIRRPLLGFTKAYQQEKVRDLLALSGLSQQKNKQPRELSGGQQQKLALSTAMAVEPEVLLLDEPFSNLDPFSKHDFLREVKRMSLELGIAVVFVTHDTRDAIAVADRIIVMSGKSIVQQGSPREIYEQPVNLEVASFFGPVNCFTATSWEENFKEKTVGDLVGIRPEDFCWSSSEPGAKGVVKEVNFNGPVLELVISLANRHEEVIVHASGDIPGIGSKVFLRANHDRSFSL